jgi:hypothetical protein
MAQWVAFYDGYDKITAWAWSEWDRLYEVRQRMQKLSRREALPKKGSKHPPSIVGRKQQ